MSAADGGSHVLSGVEKRCRTAWTGDAKKAAVAPPTVDFRKIRRLNLKSYLLLRECHVNAERILGTTDITCASLRRVHRYESSMLEARWTYRRWSRFVLGFSIYNFVILAIEEMFEPSLPAAGKGTTG